jgi:hypothetical protein
MQEFQFIMIKPSHYDDDGYVIQWHRSVIPSNSLAAIYGLAEECAAQRVLGDDVRLALTAYDETNTAVHIKHIVKQINGKGGGGLVGLVGVQSNQFPRAMDIARPMRAAGIQVCIGGFHVSGCLAMLPDVPDDLREAQALGISLFAGEAESGGLAEVLRDAHRGELKPLYNHLNDLPALESVTVPFLPIESVRRTATRMTSFDAGRGCPFQCSFCTIINVQGHKSRYRSPDDIEKIIRLNAAQGVHDYLVTDDNFARNRNWEPLFDRLIKLREGEGVAADLVLQVDTLCHRIPRFIEKAARAGVFHVFIGLENINPDNLKGAKKRQNRISEYRSMLQAWKRAGVVTFAGYIVGFPNDTPESILRDIRIVQRELPVDFLEFFVLTPLPGSEDHRRLWEQGVPMDTDMNKYDLNHVTVDHPRMSREELDRAWREAWSTYYSTKHMATTLRRALASGIPARHVIVPMIWFWSSIFVYGIHPLEGGLIRRRARLNRRPGLPTDGVARFYFRYCIELLTTSVRLIGCLSRIAWIVLGVWFSPSRGTYVDESLAPAREGDFSNLVTR